MKTIRDNLEYCIRLLETNFVQRHIEACHLVYVDLSSVDGFDMDVLSMLAHYQAYLIDRHQSMKKVGFFKKVSSFMKSISLKRSTLDFVNRVQSKQFGDGDVYIQKIAGLIRRAI